jgi:tetratricopeptide (TPR) repeat protein
MQAKILRAATVAGFVALAALFSTSAFAKSDQLQVSPAIAKQIAAVQKLLAAGDYQAALDQVHAAQAASGRTPDDDYIINEFIAAISIKLKDIPTATVALEAMADSPLIDKDSQKTQTLSSAMIAANGAKHYAKVIAYAQKLEAIQPLSDTDTVVLAQAYYFSNDLPHAKETAEKGIAAAKAAGKVPAQSLLQIVFNSQNGSHDEAGSLATLEEMAGDYNDPEDWGRLIELALGVKGNSDYDALNLLRLAVVTNAHVDASEYSIMSEIGMRRAFFGDAEVAERHGAKALGASAKAAKDQKDLPGLLASAPKQDAKYNFAFAQDLYGYGRYAEAEELARRALAKGWAAGDANMLIGICLVGEGKYTDAVAIFQQVQGTPTATRAAHLWSLYASHKATPPAAPAEAPAH